MNNKTAQLRKELDNLIEEEDRLEKLIYDADQAKVRLAELISARQTIGLLELKTQEWEDSKWPVFTENDYYRLRVVGLNNKWISIKMDGCNQPVLRYNRLTGELERMKGQLIDINKAMNAWNAWQAQNRQAETELCALRNASCTVIASPTAYCSTINQNARTCGHRC